MVRRRRRTARRIRVAHVARRAAREDAVRVVDDWFAAAGRRSSSPARCAAGDGPCATAAGPAAATATGADAAADGAALDVVVEAFDDVACGGGFFEVGAFLPVDLLF